MEDNMYLLVRFFSKIDSCSEGKCWNWNGSKRNSGRKMQSKYGTLRVVDKVVASHRLSYEIHNGKIGDKHVLHVCDNTLCVNPSHLVLGTHTDNMRDKILKRRDHNLLKTHCPSGHEYSVENTYINPQGSRKCRKCLRRAWSNHDKERRKW